VTQLFKKDFLKLIWNSWIALLLIGVDIVRKALRMPCMQIAKNAGIDASVVVAKVEELDSEVGYDAMNNEYVNMIEKGIIDPTKVWHLTFTCIWKKPLYQLYTR